MSDQSLYYFTKYVLGYDLLEPQPHLNEICPFIERNLLHDFIMLVPRGTFKSTICSIAAPLWLLTKNRDLRILLSSYEQDNTKNWLNSIKTHIEDNRAFRLLYGALDSEKDSKTWTTFALKVSGGTRVSPQPSIVASSLKSSSVSQHYDLAILDDLQVDKNLSSRELIEEVVTYGERLNAVMDPQPPDFTRRGPRWFIGTRWDLADAYGLMISADRKAKKEGIPPAFRLLIREAYIENKRTNETTYVFFPKLFSKESLLKMKREKKISDALFSANWLNNPRPDSAAAFQLGRLGFFNDIQFVRGREVRNLPPIRTVFTLFDPGGETADSDYAALVTVSVDHEWNIFVEEVRRGHWTLDQHVENMFEVFEKYHPSRFAVETYVFQRWLLQAFKSACRARNRYFAVTELPKDTKHSKPMRISGFSPFVNEGKVYLRVPDGFVLTQPFQDLYHAVLADQDELLDEMHRFPGGGTVDCLDALSYAPQVIFPASSPVEKPVIPPRSIAALRKMLRERRHSSRELTVGW